ncbi:MAG: hydroxypyruvate isomerase [Marinobacterium sp.]|nr:hydroxypyruvate isomerase [Marinobacterium sp.]
MPVFAANLSTLFTEIPFIERFAAARKAGFDHVEIQFPYELGINEIAEQLQLHRQQLTLINLPAGNWAAGERGIACHADRREEFRQGVQQALKYANALKIPCLNCLAGITPSNQPYYDCEKIFLQNLTYAADIFKESGINLLIEAINTCDIPGFWLNNSRQAFEIIDKLDKLNAAFQYDVYHMQIMEGNLIHTLEENLSKIGHIQIADVPGRHEPGTGEINFPNLFKALDTMGYSGVISLEYNPAGQTVDGLHWLSHTD